jgi:medium-chain acyl-[acyl-carrier-protein] hydrolase
MSSGSSSGTRWTITFAPRPTAAMRIFALPFAGGGASVFRPWTFALPAWVELRAIQLPGRQDRAAEQPMSDMGRIVEALADALAPDLSAAPYALFGHSMGALLGFELVRKIRRCKLPGPTRLGVSGWPSPRLRPHLRTLVELPDEEFIGAVQDLGGLPDAILAAPDLLAFALPALRADFAACADYKYEPESPLQIPISAFGGSADPLSSRAALASWGEETTGGISVRLYPGNHFYLLDHMHTVSRDLVYDLEADGVARRGSAL